MIAENGFNGENADPFYRFFTTETQSTRSILRAFVFPADYRSISLWFTASGFVVNRQVTRTVQHPFFSFRDRVRMAGAAAHIATVKNPEKDCLVAQDRYGLTVGPCPKK